jgi:hypothetical protein
MFDVKFHKNICFTKKNPKTYAWWKIPQKHVFEEKSPKNISLTKNLAKHTYIFWVDFFVKHMFLGDFSWSICFWGFFVKHVFGGFYVKHNVWQQMNITKEYNRHMDMFVFLNVSCTCSIWVGRLYWLDILFIYGHWPKDRSDTLVTCYQFSFVNPVTQWCC